MHWNSTTKKMMIYQKTNTYKTMAIFKVVHEINVEAKNALEAAKIVQGWMDNADTNWQFYVQEYDRKEVFSVDLSEDDSEAVLPVKTYEPMIEAKKQDSTPYLPFTNTDRK